MRSRDFVFKMADWLKEVISHWNMKAKINYPSQSDEICKEYYFFPRNNKMALENFVRNMITEV